MQKVRQSNHYLFYTFALLTLLTSCNWHDKLQTSSQPCTTNKAKVSNTKLYGAKVSATHVTIKVVADDLISNSKIKHPRIDNSSNHSQIKGNNEFKLIFRLSNHEHIIDWKFGFFMLYVFADPQKISNMMICDLKTVANSRRCMSLVVDKKPPSHSLTDFSTPDVNTLGHITLLKPKSVFPLVAGGEYELVLHGMKIKPQNQTAMPQKVFIYNVRTKQFIKLTTLYANDAKTQIYDGNNRTKQPISVLVNEEIELSQNLSRKQLISPIVPLPHKIELDQKRKIVEVAIATIPQVHLCLTVEHSADKNQLKNSLSDKSILVKKDELITCELLQKAGRGSESQNYQPEGYILDIGILSNPRSHVVNIYANSVAGVFYAKKSLEQLQAYYNFHIPAQRIIDYPRYKYRGIMLDSVRHFFSVNEVKLLLDVMAAHKLNTLHLHLADDEGWRLELPQYPQLTRIGATRGFNHTIGAANLVDSNISLISDNADIDSVYHGYYTKDQIKGLIQYANQQQITIIPEIEMPAHARAMKRALPKLFFEVDDNSKYYTVQGYTDNILPVCKYNHAAAAIFTQGIDDILFQVAEIFNHQSTIYAIANEVSISADEVPATGFTGLKFCQYGQWQGKDVTQITHLFFKNITENLPQIKLSGFAGMIESQGNKLDMQNRKLLVPVRNVGHIWVWEKSGNYIADNGMIIAGSVLNSDYPVVLEFANLSYFDTRYTTSFNESGLYWAASHAGTFEAWQMGKFKVKNAVGVEGALWSELLPTVDQLFYMALPKMSGIAEAAWSQQSMLNWGSLSQRLGYGKTGFLAYLHNKYGVMYRGYPNGITLDMHPNK